MTDAFTASTRNFATARDDESSYNDSLGNLDFMTRGEVMEDTELGILEPRRSNTQSKWTPPTRSNRATKRFVDKIRGYATTLWSQRRYKKTAPCAECQYMLKQLEVVKQTLSEQNIQEIVQLEVMKQLYGEDEPPDKSVYFEIRTDVNSVKKEVDLLKNELESLIV